MKSAKSARTGAWYDALRRRMVHMPPGVGCFALFTLAPVPFLVIGCVYGAPYIWVGVIWSTLVIHILDRLILYAAPNAPEGMEFPAANGLSVVLGIAHFLLLMLSVAALSGATGLSITDRIGVFLGCGLFFGQVSNANAHELIHRSNRSLFRLGLWVYVSLLYGQHVSAHRLVHHPHVATPQDPNTARAGEGFWAFLPRAAIGEFRAGWQAERSRLARRAPNTDHKPRLWVTPYSLYLTGGAAILVIIWSVFGGNGMIGYLALCIYAQIQILLADYVQHYGLVRQVQTTKTDRISGWHSWDAPAPISSLWMLNAPRHADHHMHPARPYPALSVGPQAILPFSLPVMATIALFPTAWHRLMTPRLRRLQKAQGAAEQSPSPIPSDRIPPCA